MLILESMNARSVIKKLIPSGVFLAIEPFGHLCEAVIVNAKYGFPARGMNIIGITGTNGKTTTVFMVHRMLTTAGYKVGMISTVAYGIGEDIRPQMTHMTTPTTPVLMQRLKRMKREQVDWVVLETTSQALAQNRVWGIPYSVVVMTNLTHEHLSYHKTFERYRAAKVKLFKMANNNRRGLRQGIVNADDLNSKYFSQAIKFNSSYGINAGDIRAHDIKLEPAEVSYVAEVAGTTYHIRSRLPGTVNVYNSLAALSVGHVLGLKPHDIEKGIYALTGVEGRMTKIEEGQDFTVIVDYAHTPDSFEKLFQDVRPLVKGRLIVLFGSLGGGDKGKRPIQGELAGKYADIVIICEEDDRKEKPETIQQDIAQGVERAGKRVDDDLFLIHDRPAAIRFAMKTARKGDMVLLLGKGHEKTIEHADGEHPWDEIGTARKAVIESRND